MHRVDTTTAVAAPPAVQGEGAPGYFDKGNPTSGLPATVPGPDWFNMMQEELVAILTAFGETPDQTKADYGQLATALLVNFANIGGNASQLFKAAPGVAGNDVVTIDQLLFDNKLINGNFSVNQRAVAGTVVLAAGEYAHDRWRGGAAGCTYTFATVENVTTITISAGSYEQVVEGINLQSGDHVLSWAGTAQGQINGGGFGDSGLSAALVGGANATVEFGVGTVAFTKLEAGPVATPFVIRSVGREESLCRRYYWALPGGNTIWGKYHNGATRQFLEQDFSVQMRAVPTITYALSAVVTDLGSYSTTMKFAVYCEVLTDDWSSLGSATADAEI